MSGVPPEDLVYLRHILDAISRIESYLDDVDRSRFDSTPLIQDGVIRQLEIIGEATKRLSSQAQSRAEHIPWRKIAGMRDKLTHDYMGVDLEAVWLAAQQDLDPLKNAVAGLLSRQGTESNGA